jgi:hypothetical protein
MSRFRCSGDSCSPPSRLAAVPERESAQLWRVPPQAFDSLSEVSI